VEFKEAPPEQVLRVGEDVPVPRQAATVVLVRGGADALELLLVRRTLSASFMAGVWVFPGGAVEGHEGAGDAAHRLAAVRELHEEAGIVLADPAALVKYSRWITPAVVRTRFDTHFFLAPLPAGQEPRIDEAEIIDLAWFTPQGALDAHTAGNLDLVFPTIKHLEQFAGFPTMDALLAYAGARDVQPVTPRIVMEGEIARIVLPGEPGYDGA